jgi:hypothetical protein
MRRILRRVIIIAFALIAFGSAATDVQAGYCPWPGDACRSCGGIGAQCVGSWGYCCYGSYGECCQDALCEMWDEETQQYQYWYANYHWCAGCCDI